MGRPQLKQKKGRKKNVFIRAVFEDHFPKKKGRPKRKSLRKDIIVKKQLVRVNITPDTLERAEDTVKPGFIQQFGYIYSLRPQTVPIEADVMLDTNGILTSGITHVPGTAQITVADAGIYEVHFSVSGIEPNQFAIYINGALAEGTIYGSGADTQQNTGQAIVSLACGDMLTLRNHSSSTMVILQTSAGGVQVNVNASILIRKLI